MLKFGVIGLGIGRSHALAMMRNANCTVAAICDTDTARMEKVAQELGGCVAMYTDYRDMLTHTELDGVCVASPDHLHRDMVCDALRAGLHVLCEKPLALHADECMQMIETAAQTGRKLMVGQVCRVAPAFVLAKQIIDEGLLGEIFFIESEYAHDYINIRGWRMDPDIRRHPVTGGGCHAVDLVRFLTGREPLEAFSYSNHKMLPDWPCDDTTIAVLKFEDDIIGKVLTSTGCKRDYTMRTVIYGSRGTVICDNTTPHISLYVEQFEGAERFMGKRMQNIAHIIPVSISSHNIEAEIAEFCDCILRDVEPAIGAIEGARTVAVCEAIVRSSETGLPEKIVY